MRQGKRGDSERQCIIELQKHFQARRHVGAPNRGGGYGAHGKQTSLLLAVAHPSWPDFYFITRHDLVQ